MSLYSTQKYQELWSKPKTQERIQEGIRRYRQSDASIRITDYEDKPLAGVRLKVKQHDAAFHFGANIFKLGGYPDESLNKAYEDAFCGLFNGATVPFYWRALEPEQGNPRYGIHSVPISRRPPPDRVVSFCQAKGLRMHGHTLVWNQRKWSIPDWLPLDPEQAAPFWEKRIQEIAERYGDNISSWDAVNEAALTYARGTMGLPMQQDYENICFRWAEKYFPDTARLDINETTKSWDLQDTRYTDLIRKLIAKKRRIGAIGLQFHNFQDQNLMDILKGERFGPNHLFGVLDHYAQFNCPFHISEITLTAPGNSPEGQEAQAVVAENLYRLWFSHPNVEAITWWNFPDGGAAQGEDKVYSGLLCEDMAPKLAYHRLKRLIRDEWRTETSGVTDENGCFYFRGFHGTYHINTNSGIESSMTLHAGSATEHHIRL